MPFNAKKAAKEFIKNIKIGQQDLVNHFLDRNFPLQDQTGKNRSASATIPSEHINAKYIYEALYQSIIVGNAPLVIELLKINFLDVPKKSDKIYRYLKKHPNLVIKGIIDAHLIGVQVSPLHLAVLQGNTTVIRQLLATPNINGSSEEVLRCYAAAKRINADFPKLSYIYGEIVNLFETVIEMRNNNRLSTQSHIHRSLGTTCYSPIPTPAISMPTCEGPQAFFTAIKEGNLIAINEYLLQYGEAPNAIQVVNAYGNTPLIEAVKSENISTVAKLLSIQSLNVNGRDANGDTALHLALKSGLFDIAKLLIIDARVDENLPDRDNHDAQWLATQLGSLEICMSVLAKRNARICISQMVAQANANSLVPNSFR